MNQPLGKPVKRQTIGRVDSIAHTKVDNQIDWGVASNVHSQVWNSFYNQVSHYPDEKVIEMVTRKLRKQKT